MERSYKRRYTGRHKSARRNGGGTDGTQTLRLAACGVIFAFAALIKLLFPGFAAGIGEKITTAVDYKAALSALGEGISGDKEFISAVGEAITHAFRGAPAEGTSPGGDDVSLDPGGTDEAFDEDPSDIPAWSYGGDEPPEEPADAGGTGPGDTGEASADEPNDFASAIISAFLQTQEGYSDYDLPAGATYDMPVIGAAYAAPVTGNVTSPFGYRTHPVDGSVKFHYGIDIAAEQDAPVTAFADGSVLAVGESTTLGKYVIITHDGFETLYAHCGDVCVLSGQAVKMGQAVASVGDTGNATSFCLHFELKVGGMFVNPGYYLTSNV